MNERILCKGSNPVTQSIKPVKALPFTDEQLIQRDGFNLIPMEIQTVPHSAFNMLNMTLRNLEPLAEEISQLRRSVREQEAEALEHILKRIWGLLPLLNGEQESYYRDRITLIEREERVQTGADDGYRNRSELIFYEDQRLVLVHTVEYWGHATARVCTVSEEYELSCLDAVKSFGLNPIAEGLLKSIKSIESFIATRDELKSRLENLIKILEAIQ